MNKRLLLALYDRSGLGAYMPVDYKGHELAVEEHMEKFAKLIVRECMKINKVETTALDLPEYNLGMLEGYRRARENISIHFGVKE